MKFRYLKFPSADPKRKWISRPVIPIQIEGPKGKWEGYALIDSGADRSLFSFEIGEIIGLEVSKGRIEYFGGIGGARILAYLHKIQIQILGFSESVEILAGFTESPGVSAILGQEGFFDAYRIKFERDQGMIEISPV